MSDGKLVALNGELRFVTKISVKRRNDGFIVHQDFLEHNSKPNCQGKSPEYILSRFVHDIYFERNGAFLRQYIWTKETGRFIEFVRREAPNPRLKTDVENARLSGWLIRHGLAA
jgi:hypothetical protein